MASLRARLLAGTIIGIMLLLAVFSLIVYAVIHSALIKQFDASLASVAQMLAASIEVDGKKIEADFEVQQMPEFHDAEHPTYYQLWQADDVVAARSPLLGTNDLTHPKGAVNSVVLLGLHQTNGHLQREAGLTFVPRDADKDEDTTPLSPTVNEQLLTLTVARDASDLYGQLRFLRRLLLVASAAVILLSLLIATIIVRKGLDPLNSIAAEIAMITEDNLTTRIAGEHVPDEVIPIRDRLNELMSRLEASFCRERQFNADVAHELRTPLAGLRSTIEVTLAHSRQNEEYRRALSDCLEITKTMQSMVGNLLTLAGLSIQGAKLHFEQVKTAEVVDMCWNSFSDKAFDRGISFDDSIHPEMAVETDRRILSSIISNVLDNAAEYTDENGQIRVAACKKDDALEISVSNTGCQLTGEQVSHVFDCFWRADSSRSDAGAHCGLGLALVRKLTRALGGDATAEIQPGAVFVLKLNVPVKPPRQKH
jgi:signal transduction histidine kinase